MKYTVPKLYTKAMFNLSEAVCMDGNDASSLGCKSGPEASSGCGSGAAAGSKCLTGAAAGSKCDSGAGVGKD